MWNDVQPDTLPGTFLVRVPWRSLMETTRTRMSRRTPTVTGSQNGPIPSSFSAFLWPIFSLVARGRSSARSQSAPARLLTNG